MSEPFAPDCSRVARVLPSPNFGERRGPTRPDCVILHYTGMPTAEAALALLRDPASEVSSHYLVWENGEIAQLVAEDKRAWHAGVSVWGGAHDGYAHTVNSHINRLRSKIEAEPTQPRYILTVWGIGYKFADGHGATAS